MDLIFSTVIIIMVIALVIFVICSNVKWENERKALDKKYNVTKFPVTSLRGNQYYAEITYNHERFSYYEFTCTIYKRVPNKKGKLIDEEISSRGFDFKEVDYDYIKIVKKVIESYEKSCIKNNYIKESVTTSKKLFENWDGIIKEDK